MLFTATLLLMFVGGLIFRQHTSHFISTAGREARLAEVQVPVFFAPGSADRVVMRIEPGAVVWVRYFDHSSWVAVFEEEQSRFVLGFSPDSAFSRATLQSRENTDRSRRWSERMRVWMGGADGPPR